MTLFSGVPLFPQMSRFVPLLYFGNRLKTAGLEKDKAVRQVLDGIALREKGLSEKEVAIILKDTG
ncbi:MAG: hypothetical protein IKW74_03770 [Thermoguttaceae bacterium]|nr:hypothetical protein [Thermoguttaceae bacterium]